MFFIKSVIWWFVFMAEQLYTVRGKLSLNLELLSKDFILPTLADLENEKPAIFKLCRSLEPIDYKTVRDLKEDGAVYGDLVAIIEQQRQKINQILSFLISVYDKKFEEFVTYDFSGNGFSFVAPNYLAIETGTVLRTRIYLSENVMALYCYAIVTDIECNFEDNQQKLIRAEFVRITESDRDMLIATSFKLQRCKLRQRAKLKEQSK